MPITCAHVLCTILPLIASPIEPGVKSRPKFENPTPWRDAFCYPVNYVTYDPVGLHDGMHVAIHLIEDIPGMMYERRIFCESSSENKKGYF